MSAETCPGLIDEVTTVTQRDGFLGELLKETNAFYCLSCGKCSGGCPVSVVKPDFSPRRIVELALIESEESITTDISYWDCLTCGKCSNYCPEDVQFPIFIRNQRKEAPKSGNCPMINHGGITYSIADTMANLDTEQDRLCWVKDVNIADKGDILLFTGCLVHFDIIFEPLRIDSGDNILNNAVKIMNKAGIVPAVMPDEVCCGHDHLWAGDEKTFRKLMKKNLEAIKNTGARRIVTVCPEGTVTLKKDYARYGGLDLEVVHISEFIAELLENGKIDVRSPEGRITFHDPCRLAQHLKIIDAPRNVIKAVNPDGFIEMKDSKEMAFCCGTSLFRNCDAFSEAIRSERLSQAMATDAECLLTACPKCQIHFKCTLSTKCEEQGLNPDLKVKDLVTYVAENME